MIREAHLREAQLGDFFDDNQMQAIMDLLNRQDLDDLALTKALKAYLGRFRDDLLAKGLNSDYMAYWLLANADALRQMAANRNHLN